MKNNMEKERVVNEPSPDVVKRCEAYPRLVEAIKKMICTNTAFQKAKREWETLSVESCSDKKILELGRRYQQSYTGVALAFYEASGLLAELEGEK